MLSKKAERRLTKLVKFMASLPKSAEAHFNMGSWFNHDGCDHDHGLGDGREVTRRDMNLCGTSACALGWAATIPSFRKAGLSMDSSIAVPYFQGYGLTAAANFFDIGMVQAHALFSGTKSDRTPKQWAKRARKLLRQWRKE